MAESPLWEDFDRTAAVPSKSAESALWDEFDKSQPGDTAKGFKRAFAQVPEFAYGAGALAAMSAEKLFGEGGLSTAAKDYFAEKYVAKQAENQKYAPSVEFTDAWENLKAGDVGSMADWLQDTAGYVVGQGLQTLATGGIGALAGKAALAGATEKMLGSYVANQAAKIAEAAAGKMAMAEATKLAAHRTAQAIGAGLALSAQNTGMEAGDIYGGLMEQAEKTGEPITGDDLLRAWGMAAAAAGTETATDLLGLGAVTGRIRIGGKAMQEMTGVGGRAARGATAAAIGMPIEAGQEYAQTYLEQVGAGQPTDTPEAQRERINAAAVGGVGGTVMGGGIGLISGARPATPPPSGEPIPTTPEAIANEVMAAPDLDSAIAKTAEITGAGLIGSDIAGAIDKEIISDRQNIQGIPGQEREGQEPVQAGAEQGRGAETVETGRVFQEQGPDRQVSPAINPAVLAVNPPIIPDKTPVAEQPESRQNVGINVAIPGKSPAVSENGPELDQASNVVDLADFKALTETARRYDRDTREEIRVALKDIETAQNSGRMTDTVAEQVRTASRIAQNKGDPDDVLDALDKAYAILYPSAANEAMPAPATTIPAQPVAPQEAPKAHDYSSTQTPLPGPVGAQIKRAAARIIAPQDVDPTEGLEQNPHITVKYGLHTDNADEVRPIVRATAPIKARITGIEVFKNDEHDVLVARLESPDLAALNKRIADALPNTETHDDYRPHITLGYVKSGMGEKYAKAKTGLEGREITLNTVEFSSKNGTVTPIKLEGRPPTLETKTPHDLPQKAGTIPSAAQKSGPKRSTATITQAQNVGTSPQVSAVQKSPELSTPVEQKQEAVNLPKIGTIIPKSGIPSEVSGGQSDVAKGIERPSGKILGADVRKIADVNLARFAKSKTARIADLAKSELAWRNVSREARMAANKPAESPKPAAPVAPPRPTKPRMGETANELYAELKKAASGVVDGNYGVLYPVIRLPARGGTYRMESNGNYVSIGNRGMTATPATKVEISDIEDAIDTDTAEVNLMTRWGGSGRDNGSRFLRTLHSPSGNSWAQNKPAAKPEATPAQPAAEPTPEPPVSAPAEKPVTTIADHLEAAAKLMREAEKPARTDRIGSTALTPKLDQFVADMTPQEAGSARAALSKTLTFTEDGKETRGELGNAIENKFAEGWRVALTAKGPAFVGEDMTGWNKGTIGEYGMQYANWLSSQEPAATPEPAPRQDSGGPDVESYSRDKPGPGLPAADIRAHIAGITGKLSVAVPVYDSVEQARLAGFKIADDAQGFAKGDRLGLISGRIKTLFDAEKTLFHELWHVGIKRVTSDPDAVKAFANYNAALNRVAMANPGVRKRAAEWRQQYGKDKRQQFEDHKREQLTDAKITGKAQDAAIKAAGPELELRVRLQSFDEAIADMAGKRRGKPVTRLNELIAALQRLVRALGFDELASWMESKTDAEVLSLIRAATQSVSKDTTTFAGVMAGEPSYARLDQTQTAEFKRWFKDSRVVDAEGKPLVVYHGTDADISSFDPSIQLNTAFPKGVIWFSDSPRVAAFYAEQAANVWQNTRSEGAIYPVFIRMERPYLIPASEVKKVGVDWAVEFVEYLNQGFDGIIAKVPSRRKHGTPSHMVYGVFRPEQIKSAIGNRGTFDPGDPDIMLARAGSEPFNAIQQSRGVANAVAGLFKSPSALGPVNFFNTPFHKAEMLERKGIPGYKRVFQRLQLYLNDISGFAVQAEQLMPSIMRELKGIMPKDFRAYFKGATSEADIAAIGPWLNHGTLYGGSSPMEGVVWTDEELRGNETRERPIPRGLKPLTAAQIPLYRQARAGIGQSLETSGKAVIHRHVTKFGITFDRDMSLADVAEIVRDQVIEKIETLQIRIDRAKDEAGTTFTDSRRLEAEVKNYQGARAGLHDLRAAWEKAKAADDKASKYVEKLQAEQATLEALRGDTTEEADRKRLAKEKANPGTIRGIAQHAKALIDHGYMPLKRFGNKTVTAYDEDGNTKFFGAYDGTPLTPGSANREMLRVAAEVKALHPEWRVVTGTRSEKAWKMYQGLSMDALENFLDFLDPETKAELERDKTIQEYLKNAVNDHSVLKQLIHRKGTPGFSTDVPRILASFVTSHARNASGLYHLAEAQRLVGEIPDQYGTVKDEAADLVEYVKKPGEEAAVLRSFLFFNFLGGSVAAAAINLTQTVMTTVPYLSQYTGVGKLTAAIGRAGKLAVGDPAVMTGRLGKDLQRAELEGITAPQQIYHLAAMASNNPFSSDRRFRTAMAVWNGMFGAAEVFNRRIAFIAAHDIATERGMDPINEQLRKFAESRGEDAKHFDNAYDFAADAVDQTQFIYNKANRMNAARGPIGATVMTFKTFSVSWLELLRRLPPKQQLVMLGVLVLMAGAEGLPFEEDISDTVNTLGQWLGFTTNTGKWTGKVIRETLGSEFERPILKGLGGMLPIDLHSRLGLPNLIPGTAFFMPSEINKTRDVAEAFGPVGGIMRNFMDGLQLMARGKWDRAALQAAPKAARDFYNGAYMMATGESQDTKGRLAMTDMTAAEGLGKLIGFNPQRAAREGEARREEMLDKNLRTVRMDEIASDWADGVIRKDQDKQKAARERLREWNRDNPELRIDGQQILRSVRERVKTARMTSQQRFLKSLPKTMRPEAREAFR